MKSGIYWQQRQSGIWSNTSPSRISRVKSSQNDRHQSTTSQDNEKYPVLENTRSKFFFHWSPKYFYSHYPNVLDVLLCPPELACITRQRCMRMFSSRVASNTASTRGIQITFYNWLLSLMTLFLRCWLWWGSRKIIDHCRCFGAHFWNVATYCWCFLQCLCNSWEGNWTWVLVPCASAITV